MWPTGTKETEITNIPWVETFYVIPVPGCRLSKLTYDEQNSIMWPLSFAGSYFIYLQTLTPKNRPFILIVTVTQERTGINYCHVWLIGSRHVAIHLKRSRIAFGDEFIGMLRKLPFPSNFKFSSSINFF